MHDLIGVGVADTTEYVRIGEGPLQGVVLASQSLRELRGSRAENLETTGVKPGKSLSAPHHVQ